VGPAYKAEAMFVAEVSHNITPEGEGHAAIVLTPPCDVLQVEFAHRNRH